MSFSLRPFSACVEALRTAEPNKNLNSETKELEHYDSLEAHSFDPIGGWANWPPLSVLYRQRDPFRHSSNVLRDPGSFVDYCNFGGAVATWNANGEGHWKHGEDWIVVEVELMQEQADEDEMGVNVVFALWRVEDGWAAAVWRPAQVDRLAKVMGFDPWNDAGTGSWEPCTVWYGE